MVKPFAAAPSASSAAEAEDKQPINLDEENLEKAFNMMIQMMSNKEVDDM